jgi:hypothetical protein
MDYIMANLIETIYIGCENNKSISLPTSSHIVRFCADTAHAHCTIMCLLSDVFFKAQLISDEDYAQGPYRVSIMWPEQFVNPFKRKPSNAETSYDVMKWFLNNMLPPKNGMIVSIDRYEQKQTVATPWTVNQLWPFKKQWNKKGKFISIHKSEPLMSKRRIGGLMEKEKTILPNITKIAHEFGYDVKFIHYSLTMEEIYDTLLSTTHHFSYDGGTYYTAGMTGTPTTKYTHYYDNLPDTWGFMGISPNKILQFRNEVVSAPIEYSTISYLKPEEIRNILND